MYWPIGTPRIYATTTSQAPARTNLVVSHDGIASNALADNDSLSTRSSEPPAPVILDEKDRSIPDSQIPPIPPITPGLKTPATPAINSVEHDVYHDGSGHSSQQYLAGPGGGSIPAGEPIVALKVSRTGHLFAVITATTMTVWQTKVCVLYDDYAALRADSAISL